LTGASDVTTSAIAHIAVRHANRRMGFLFPDPERPPKSDLWFDARSRRQRRARRDRQAGHPRLPRSAGLGVTTENPDAERALAWIGALYELDRSAGDDSTLRAALRQAKAPAILDELKAWLWTQADLTSSSIGKAAAYTLGIWDRLTASSTTPASPSTTTQPSAQSAVRSSDARITTARSHAAHRGGVSALHDPRDVQLREVDPAAYLTAARRCRPRRTAVALGLRGASV
jgi:hypothetical protein